MEVSALSLSLIEPNPRLSLEPTEARPTFRLKAPFLLTRMRDWRGRGRRCAWLWARRGREWVIEQELYLGRFQQLVPPTPDDVLLGAGPLEQPDLDPLKQPDLDEMPEEMMNTA
jgi:hypothetical protein